MNTITREFLRNNLLIQLAAGGERGLALSTLALGARVAGFRIEKDDELKPELAYLVDKGLAANVSKALSPENGRTRITADGRDYLAQEGLA